MGGMGRVMHPSAAAVRDALRELALDDDIDDISVDTVKSQYRRLALKWHPDKRRQARGAQDGHDAAAREADADAEDRFKRLSAAYELLSEIKRGHSPCDTDVGEPFDFEEYCKQFSPSDSILSLFKAALLGQDVEQELQIRGIHRPPTGFGIAPFPPFDAGGPPGASAEDAGLRCVPASDAITPAAKPTLLGEEFDRMAWFTHELRLALSGSCAALAAAGITSPSLGTVSGNAHVLRKFDRRTGAMRRIPTYDLRLDIKCALVAGSSSCGIPCRIHVPHIGDEDALEGMDATFVFATRRGELTCRRELDMAQTTRAAKAVLARILGSVLGRLADTVAGEET